MFATSDKAIYSRMKQRFTLVILITLLVLPFKSTFCQSLNYLSYAEELKSQGFNLNDKLAPFYHGVASGDPLSDRLIIWTRVTPPKKEASKNDWKLAFSVSWKVATDTAFNDVVRNGDIATDETKDFTVKVDVTGLKPNTTYYYQFEAFGKKSMTGTTKTAYGVEDELPVKLAFVDGNDFSNGYFNAYSRIAEIKDLNAVVVLSGYIDEGAGGNLRKHIPAARVETLQDYRNRYAQYHLDEDLIKAHATYPFIIVWERQSINATPEKWDDSQKAAEQAFVEWLPVRVTKGEFQRRVTYGKMLDMFMIETQPLQSRGALASTNAILEDEVTLMTQPQREWITKQINYSTSVWKVLANRNLMSSLNAEVEPITSKTYDVWDNHPKDKESLLGFIRSFSLKNIIVATGGFHNALGAEVAESITGYDPEKGKYAAVIEVSLPSVSSPALTDQNVSAGSQVEAKCMNKTVNPHIKTANFSDHGFVVMSFSKKETLLNWYYMKENKLKNITKLKSQTELTVKNGVSILEK